MEELNFSNRTSKVARIVELKIANEEVFIHTVEL